MFKDDVYEQIDGFSMGSSMGPVLVNLFMDDHERNRLQKFAIGEVLLYRRYVGDIFCMFKKEIEPELSFKYLKSKHPNTKPSMEKINQQFLPFSEVLVKNEGRTSTSSVYRKKTYIT